MARKCNFCDSQDNEIIYNYARFSKANILKCKKCGLVFLETKLDKQGVEWFYNKEYRKIDILPTVPAKKMFNHPVVIRDSKERIKWVKKHFGSLKNKKVLEIGSSIGSFLKALSDEGAKVIGVELGEDYSEYSRSLGFIVYSKPIEDLNFENEFDLVVTFQTLEHVFDPMAVIKTVYKSLKIGGIFMGEIPNEDDWRIKIFDNEVVKRFHYAPYHYYYFSPKTFSNYLKKCKFKEIKLETVERYNSLIQLKRILCGEYGKKNINKILRDNIFAKPKDDVRITKTKQEEEFNRIFERGLNTELMGNCLRWVCRKI